MDLVPEWIDREAWDGFVEMRKSIKKPMTTARAMNRLINRLQMLRDKGHDPNECLDQSTFHNWQDVYPLKAEVIPNVKPTPTYEAPARLTKEEIEAAAENKAKVMNLIQDAFKLKRVA